MQFAKIKRVLKANGFTFNEIPQTYCNDRGGIVCKQHYIEKNGEHVATMDSYNKRLVTFEKLDKPDCLGSNLKHLHEYEFSEITEALLQDLHLYTTEEATAERCLERNF